MQALLTMNDSINELGYIIVNLPNQITPLNTVLTRIRIGKFLSPKKQEHNFHRFMRLATMLSRPD